MNGSTIPAALDALVAVFSGAGTSLEVIDGPAYDPQNVNFLCVAWDEGEEDAVTATRAPADAGLSQDGEVYDVICLLSSHVGTKGTLSQLRTQAFGQFTALCNAIAVDRSLGRVVTRARVTDYALSEVNTSEGLDASIRFIVHVESWK